ncbi:alkaline phosphatase D family protein [Pseudomonas sp. B21-028]|uniref:alkaline phosphatase D family protein n=1 Tax=Pseudomonas sp. B21-028 TaxID=2895480 RepID=UPI00215F0F0C|nr:alkaline phosphatase D family protein [Pseudomonas sp. B21-028]UVL84466.1 alkaline phosphatase D family protein [Pseudomonas sp. B21-028]
MFKPTVGPIVGHTTTDHARIFLRGDKDPRLAVFAGLRYRRRGDTKWMNEHFIQLHAHRDMTDVIILRGLQAGTAYEYQAGWFTTPHTTAPEPSQKWPEDFHRLRTPTAETGTPHAYIVGSCRYLRITAGVPTAPELGDRTFAGIQRVVDQANPPISGVLMTGDQVYLDDLNIVAPDRTYKDILFKYRTVFSQPHISRLMSTVPTYMILDDHEIEDNWPASKQVDDDILYANAMSAYELYQASHGPAHELSSDGLLSRSLPHYWYQFAHGDIEWFVTDSRTRRNVSMEDRRILDVEQEQSLLEWLVNSTARVKFIVTSVMFYPDRALDDGDAWQAFPQQRLRLLECIRRQGIKNVIFVSGDVHGSMTSRLCHSQDPGFEVHTIVASPFCNSELLPYAAASNFIFKAPMARTENGDYRYELTSTVISQDNFAHLHVASQSLHVTFHDRDGYPLQVVDIPLR